MKIAAIVEGHGDAKAFPILVRRVAERMAVGPIEMPPPMRVQRSKLVQNGELERAVEFVSRRVQPSDAIVILIDADDDCPKELAPELLSRAVACRPDRRIAVVLANHEYEAWLLAGANSIRGKRGLPPELIPPADPEAVRNAKGWLGQQMPYGYSETLDQPAFTAMLDLDEARRAPSFDKMLRELESFLRA